MNRIEELAKEELDPPKAKHMFTPFDVEGWDQYFMKIFARRFVSDEPIEGEYRIKQGSSCE